MLKKTIALTLIFALLAPMSSALAIEQEAPTPTIEEILNSYHEKSMESYATGISLCSTGSTLEEETVDTLNNAGYEAYLVTDSNFDVIEDQLNLDFSEMGLSKNKSYIVTLDGETASNSRAIKDPIFEEEIGGSSSSSSFNYTYNGKDYLMRYVTVTPTDNASLGGVSSVELMDYIDSDDLFDALALPMYILTHLAAAVDYYSITDKLYSLFSVSWIDAGQPQLKSSLMYTGTASWIVRYLQVYSTTDGCWHARTSVEYTNNTFFVTYTYYDQSAQCYLQKQTKSGAFTKYSDNYYNTDAVIETAIKCHNNYTRYFYTIEDVVHQYDGKNIITLQRWMEYSNYEPR